ncbi:MAG: hypothetical protein IJ752_06210 [Alphaproteobacteria bacterium]|nr:hypothetical protein [Alphaproteobacteria bacterium]
MSDLILTGLIAALIGAVGILSYILGKRTERNADFEKKEKTLAEVRRLRASLDDSSVVERLHNKYKR